MKTIRVKQSRLQCSQLNTRSDRFSAFCNAVVIELLSLHLLLCSTTTCGRAWLACCTIAQSNDGQIYGKIYPCMPNYHVDLYEQPFAKDIYVGVYIRIIIIIIIYY